MDDVLLFLPFFLGLGVFAGFLAGLLGIGGGIVLVPGIYYVFQLLSADLDLHSSHLMHVCVGTSLAIIVPTGASSAFAHYRKESIDFEFVRKVGGGVVLGVFLASFIVQFIHGDALRLLFASVLPIFSVLILLGRERFKAGTGADVSASQRDGVKKGAVGVFIGLLSSLVGIGGATLSVPYMLMNGISIRRAVGSASALGLVISVPATLGFIIAGYGAEGLPPFSLGYVNVLIWCCIVPMSVLVAPLGVKVGHYLPMKVLRFGFAVFIMIVAVRMWIEVL